MAGPGPPPRRARSPWRAERCIFGWARSTCGAARAAPDRIAQLVEQETFNLQVVGSIPTPVTRVASTYDMRSRAVIRLRPSGCPCRTDNGPRIPRAVCIQWAASDIR